MDAFAHQVTLISLWTMPAVWLGASWLTWIRYSWFVGACFLVSGLTSALWNYLFLPLSLGRAPDEIWRAVIFVNYEDAPLGHFLSVYLPLISKVSLVAGVTMLVLKNEV